MRSIKRLGCIALVGTVAGPLAGCVVAPPPVPLVALPGPNKTEAQFNADDGQCRMQAATPPATVSAPVPQPGSGQAAATAQAAQPADAPLTPGMVYLQCMVAHANVVQPLAPLRPVYYGYYPAYPVYSGFGDYYPFLYGGPVGFGVGFGFYGGDRGRFRR